MRFIRSMQGLVLVSAMACSSGATAPPSRLPATLAAIGAADRIPSQPFSGTGENVTAVVTQLHTCGPLPTVVAGLRDRTLVMTIFVDHTSVGCQAFLTPLGYVITAHNVPADIRNAEVIVHMPNGRGTTVEVLESGPITLP
jgi:hypothetical protein